MSLLLLLAACASSERASGPLPDGAYLWSRVHDEHTAATLAADPTDTLHALVDALSWWDGAAHHAPMALGPLPVGTVLCIRAGVPPEGVDPAPALVAAIAAARAAYPDAGGVQLDLDMPTARLGEYTALAPQLRGAAAPLPLSITALPTWLSSPELPRLADEVDHYVLQVHWDDRRQRGPALQAEVVDWVEQAGALGRPFQVALPTYGRRAYLPEERRDELFLSDPVEEARLVRAWTQDRPAALTGLLWFRLPDDTDRMVWSVETLAAVREGRAPHPRLVARAAQDSLGAWVVSVHNEGDTTGLLAAVTVEPEPLVGDGLGGAEWWPGRGTLEPRGWNPSDSLVAPGETMTLGWVRTGRAPELTVREVSR
ncbi:MAG: DUF3142 domain-containing protein [Deltaproteobacteria bacterium]|nr:DUF3142 domain-containing protein [Deltaproteobacteria bacterium]